MLAAAVFFAAAASVAGAAEDVYWRVHGAGKLELDGYYKLTDIDPPSFSGGKPIYKKTAEPARFIFHVAEAQHWYISDQHTERSCWVRGDGADLNGISEWQSFKDGAWQEDKDFKVTSAKEEGLSGCYITAAACNNFPEYRRKSFRDHVGEDSTGAGSNDAACLKRAEDFHYWCGNDMGSASVAASYHPSEWSQIYVPGSCEPGWSQWDDSCYKHIWEKKTWFEAEALCRDLDGHLCSIHSKAENRFIYQLTSGLTAWIGYSDIDQDTQYKWSDSSPTDFKNMAKDSPPNETQEEKKSKWYDWDGYDRGTLLCKKDALLPTAILRNITAEDLKTRPWGCLQPELVAKGLLEAAECPAKEEEASVPALKAAEKASLPWLARDIPKNLTGFGDGNDTVDSLMENKSLDMGAVSKNLSGLADTSLFTGGLGGQAPLDLPEVGSEVGGVIIVDEVGNAVPDLEAPDPHLSMPGPSSPPR